MSDYNKTTDFAIKDGYAPGNPAKVVKGTEIDDEFNAIATASALKADKANATFTGTTTIATLAVTNGTIDGGSY